MPKLEDIEIGVSPLTDRVYLGTVSKKDRGLWLQKTDCVSTFCAALFAWVPPGTVRVIDGSDGQRFEIEVRKVNKEVQPGDAK